MGIDTAEEGEGSAPEPEPEAIPACALSLQERKQLDMKARRAGPKKFNWERDAAGSFKMVKVKKTQYISLNLLSKKQIKL